MFEIGWTEMLVIAIVMIVVVGPKDLPRMLRTFGKTTSKMRAMAGDFRKQFDEAMKEADLDDLKTLAADARKLNPASEIKKALSPMEKAAQDVRSGLDAAMNPKKPAAPEPAPAVATPAEPLKPGAAAIPGEGTTAAKSAAAKSTPAKASPAKPASKAAPKPAKPAAKPAKPAARSKSGGAAK